MCACDSAGVRQPLLLVHGEVELVRLPVLLLPEGVELPVAEQRAARTALALGLVGGIALAGRGRRAVHVRPPAAGARLLQGALLLLARELGVVAALGAVDPPPEQRDRVDLTLDRGELQPHRVGRRELAADELAEGLRRHRHDRVRVAPVSRRGHADGLAVAHLDVPRPLADRVAQQVRVPACPLRVHEVRQRAVEEVGIDGAAVRDHVRQVDLAVRHRAQLARAQAVAADPNLTRDDQAERARAGGELRQAAHVGREVELRPTVEALVHLRAARVGYDRVLAEALDDEPVGQLAGHLRGRGGKRLKNELGRELRVLPGHVRHGLTRPVHYLTGSNSTTGTGVSSAKCSASAFVPMSSPQCMGTASRGWIRRAASAASSAVIT